MTTNLASLIDRCAGQHILVIGDAMLDSYLTGTAGGLCREAPVPVVNLTGRTDSAGGAGNAAANVYALGGHTTLLSVVGDDAEGRLLRQIIAEAGVSTDYILTDATRPTLAKHRIMTDLQMVVRFDQGSSQPLSYSIEQALIGRLQSLYPQSDAIIISDYGYGVLSPGVIAALTSLQNRYPRVLVADSRSLAAYREVGITAAKPNYQEAVQLLGMASVAGTARLSAIAAHEQRLFDQTGARIVAVTLDSDGAIVLEQGAAAYRTYTRTVPQPHPAGAGDTYTAALALALASGTSAAAAAELAAAAAAVVVAIPGTAVCPAAALRAAPAAAEKIIVSATALSERVARHRALHQRIVFTNGCFDILHGGHIAHLSQARALGDLLIVGINSDQSVRQLKGQGRPINQLADRLQVLAALSCVDYLVAFEEQTPADLIRSIRPDVFVKGGNHSRASLPEWFLVEELGGEVHILPYLAHRSTANIIERVRALTPNHPLPLRHNEPLAERALGGNNP